MLAYKSSLITADQIWLLQLWSLPIWSLQIWSLQIRFDHRLNILNCIGAAWGIPSLKAIYLSELYERLRLREMSYFRRGFQISFLKRRRHFAGLQHTFVPFWVTVALSLRWRFFSNTSHRRLQKCWLWKTKIRENKVYIKKKVKKREKSVHFYGFHVKLSHSKNWSALRL